jgi:hypothetical protein
MKSATLTWFRPRDGAVLDLQSLSAVADLPDRMLGAWMDLLWPGSPGLILKGLDIEGQLSADGPPGSRRPDGESAGITVTPGSAIVSDRSGNKFLVHVRDRLTVSWPNVKGARVRGVMVLRLYRDDLDAFPGVQPARQEVGVELGFVRLDQADRPDLLPVAESVGNGRDWSTDLRRVWHPDHVAVLQILSHFDHLEQVVWRAEPQGNVWSNEVFGRSWVRYQTMAVAAIQAARHSLETRTMTTEERVRTFTALHRQLARSVEPAATELLQLFRPIEGAGPYKRVLDSAEIL